MSTIKKINNSSTIRLVVALLAGIAVTVIGLMLHIGVVSLLIGWEVAVVVFVAWVWLIIWPMNHKRTSEFAQREDPGRVGVDILLILASVASLIGVGYALVEAGNADTNAHKLTLTLISLLSVLVSWFLIHTIYALRYARFFYGKDFEGTITFDAKNTPAYTDFLYVAFTLGMTFQVSDTNIVGSEFRKYVIRHALLSYAFGTIIVATTINLIAGL